MAEVPVPERVLSGGGWELIEEDTRKLADTPLVEVTATRVLYGDHALRERVRAATGTDRLWRSFFASRLTTRPPLSAGVGDFVVRTIARPQAHHRFVADLDSRGFGGVEKRDERDVPLRDGQRGTATRFEARIPVDGDDVAVDAWLVLWRRGEEILVAGGIYPVEPLPVAGGADLFSPPGEYREELLALVRAVG